LGTIKGIQKNLGPVDKIALVLGLLLIGITLALNDRLMAGLFPAYSISVSTGLKTAIFVVDGFFALAAIFLTIRNKSIGQLWVDGLIGLGFTLVLLAGLEVGFYFLNNQNQSRLEDVNFEFINEAGTADVQFRDEHAQAFFQRDDWLGYRPVPGMKVVASRQKGQKLLYKVTYSTDAHGRRATPVEKLEPNPDHILFFGGSYTFGEGVNDDETMPYYVSRLAPKYRAYNYGAGGYGPQHMLAKLQSQAITAEIEESEGLLIYTFINEHIARAVGSMAIHNHRGELMPYYALDAGKRPVRKGNLVSGRPILSIIYTVLGHSQTLEYFGVDLPLRLRERDFETTARIIAASRDLYREKFNSDNFYLLIYPGLGEPDLIPYLEAAGITYLDYADLPAAQDRDFWLGEGHPTAKAHKIVAEKLVEDLGLLDELNE